MRPPRCPWIMAGNTVVGHLRHGRWAKDRAGIVDQNIDAAKFGHDLSQHSLDRGGIGDVHADRQAAHAPLWPVPVLLWPVSDRAVLLWSVSDRAVLLWPVSDRATFDLRRNGLQLFPLADGRRGQAGRRRRAQIADDDVRAGLGQTLGHGGADAAVAAGACDDGDAS